MDERKQIFHVPYESRSHIGTKRFSVPGYPCLYLGSSVECCKKEIAHTQNVFSVSAFKNNKSLKVFDFCFFSNEAQKQGNLYKSLLSYPFKIASSIPTLSETKNDPFVEEYIIPQMILHGTILQRFTGKVDGIIYSSTEAIRNNLGIDAYKKHQNIVIPAKVINNKGYCKHLCELFSLTSPRVLNCSDAIKCLEDERLLLSQFEQIQPNNK